MKSYNNLFHGGTNRVDRDLAAGTWTFKDNMFYESGLTNVVDSSATTHSHNAYIGADPTVLMGTTSNNYTNSTFTFVEGPLGRYYHGSKNLVGMGSRAPADAGLYHYTVQADQTKEGDESGNVDIGFHYVAMDISENLAAGATATQSSTYSTAVASRAVDGETDGDYANGSVSHTQSNSEAWWHVDLGEVAYIEKVRIWNRTDYGLDRLSNFYVFASEEAFGSTSVSSTLAQAGVSAYYFDGAAGIVETIPIGREARYLRVQLTGTNFLNMAEVEAWTPIRAIDTDGEGLADYIEDVDGDGSGGDDPTSYLDEDTIGGNGLTDLQELQLSNNVLVNDPDQDENNVMLSDPDNPTANNQNSQFESTCAVLNGNIIVAYVDSNQGVYGLGSFQDPNKTLPSYTPRLVGYSVSINGGADFIDMGVPPLREGPDTDDDGPGSDIDSDDGDAGDPVLAVDVGANSVYLVGTAPRNDGFNGFPFWKSTDGGVAFENPIIVHTNLIAADKPWITVDNAPGTGQHDVYLTGTATVGQTKGVWLATSKDGSGGSWTNLLLSVRNTQESNVDHAHVGIPIVGATHEVYVFWFEQSIMSGVYSNWIKMRPILNRGTDLGEVSTVVQLTSTNWPNRNLFLLRTNSSSTNDYFNAFPFPVPIINPSVSKSNHLYVAYADEGAHSGDKADVFFTSSTNGGTNWGNPRRVSTVWTNDQWMPVLTVKPDGQQLFMAWYDRRNDTNNSLMEVYGRWGTIAANGDVQFATNDFKITTTSFPPVFAGTDPDNTGPGEYDPVYPPDVTLGWHYEEWEDVIEIVPGVMFTNKAANTYIGHVGEYNGISCDEKSIYYSWTDYRATRTVNGTNGAITRQQADIRLIRVDWP